MGASTVHKQAFAIDLRGGRHGVLVKREILDLEHLRDPALISLPARPGDVGLRRSVRHALRDDRGPAAAGPAIA